MNRASDTPVHRVVVGISGASGAVLGVRLLQALRQEMAGLPMGGTAAWHMRVN